jgi:glycosyltransferase involved in cell wall biosynthesis
MAPRTYNLLAIAAQPVQYQAPLFRRMAAHEDLNFRVAYCSLRGAVAAHDPEFGTTVQWDVPLMDGYQWTHVPNRGTGNGFFGLCNPGLTNIIRAGNFDAVLCYTGYLCATFWIAYAAARTCGAAFLFGTDAISLEARDHRIWKQWFKRLFWPMLYRLADQIIVPSTSTRELMWSLGIAKERVTLTPYVVDNDWWMEASARVDRSEIRASWGASSEEVVILFCAKLQPWKRPLDLLGAFAKANLPRTRLVIAGEGPLRSQLQDATDSLRLGDRVRFLGFVNQSALPAVYTAADLMVLPSEYEPFAVVVNEAMCSGCMVAVSDRVGAGPDLVAPVSRDFIFPCGNIEALTDLLRRAAGNKDSLRQLGRVARTRMECWSPRENIQATIEAVACASSHVRSRRHQGGQLSDL